MHRVMAVILSIRPFVVLGEELPAALTAQIERDPAKYLDRLAIMIAAYGQDGAIDGPGLQNVVAMGRADARSMALNRLQGADLDGDGAIGDDEMRVKAAASAASARRRLILYFGKADLDGDARISADELQAYANLVAQQSYGEEKAAVVYAVMGFDKNGDGQVTMAEVKAAIALAGSAKAGGEVKQKLKI